MLMFSRDSRGACVDVLFVHCCDDIAVVIQSMTSDCALLSSLFLSSSPLGCFCVGVCVCVCVVSQGRDAIAIARQYRQGALADEIEVRPTAAP